MTKNGAEPGRSRTRNSHLKVLQSIPVGFLSFCQLGQVWMLGLANRTEAQLWLKASFVPPTKEIGNPDGTKKTKLRPIALLETPLKVVESVAFDQDADHIIALMQEQ